jgi:hypothetical protein
MGLYEKRGKIQFFDETNSKFLLSVYMKYTYKGKYWKVFHSKNFEKFFLLKTWFLPIKSYKT